MKNNNVKIIFHIDMNMFFCSVAVIKNPSLKGKAFAIGRENTYKGVISTASYEARKYGIHSAMPQIEALKKLPSLIIVNSDFQAYKEYHNKFISLIKEYSNIVEVASIDEVYADMTQICMKRNAIDVAKEIQYRLVKEHHLPSSIGIAPTLFLAKMASDIKKPMGITILRKREIKDILYNLPVGDIFGIGKKTSPRLIAYNINTIADFMNEANKDTIIKIIGEKMYNAAYNALIGNSSNVVDPNRYDESDSISTSQTFDVHLSNYDDIYINMKHLFKRIYSRLIDEEYYTKTVTITLRDDTFRTITRSKSIDYTNNYDELLSVMEELLDDNYHDEVLRLIGIGFHNLKKDIDEIIEWNLFTYKSILEKEEILNDTIDELNKKYSNSIIRKGVELK